MILKTILIYTKFDTKNNKKYCVSVLLRFDYLFALNDWTITYFDVPKPVMK